MKRIAGSIPDELLERLRQMAAERHTSMAALVREAMEEKAKAYRQRPRSLGMVDSGHTYTARQTGDERRGPRRL